MTYRLRYAPSRHRGLAVHLLSLGANPMGGGVVEQTIFSANVNDMQLLVDAGADLNEDSNGRVPLILAASCGQMPSTTRMVEYMLTLPELDLEPHTSESGSESDEWEDPVRIARSNGLHREATLIRNEVRARERRPWIFKCRLNPFFPPPLLCHPFPFGVQRARRAALVR